MYATRAIGKSNFMVDLPLINHQTRFSSREKASITRLDGESDRPNTVHAHIAFHFPLQEHCKLSVVPRPIPSFSMLHAEKLFSVQH